MSEQDDLRDRIVEAFKRGADGYGGVEGGAQAIIDEFRLRREYQPTIRGVRERIVGDWEGSNE